MANTGPAIALTLVHEGGFVNNPNDKGGPTKFGITQADMPGKNIADITTLDAIVYYSAHYWKPLYYQITSQDIASKLFDMGVLFGIGAAVEDLQRALNVTPPPMLHVDGNFGPETLLLTNEAAPIKLLSDFKTELQVRAHAIVAQHPADAEFLEGWLRRIAS